MQIKRETWDSLVDFLQDNDLDEAIDSLAVLSEKQAQGLVNYIDERKFSIGKNSQNSQAINQVTVTTVLLDLEGYNKRNDMFVPKTYNYQPKD